MMIGLERRRSCGRQVLTGVGRWRTPVVVRAGANASLSGECNNALGLPVAFPPFPQLSDDYIREYQGKLNYLWHFNYGKRFDSSDIRGVKLL